MDLIRSLSLSTEVHLRLVARCHLGKGELKAAAALLQGSADPENR